MPETTFWHPVTKRAISRNCYLPGLRRVGAEAVAVPGLRVVGAGARWYRHLPDGRYRRLSHRPWGVRGRGRLRDRRVGGHGRAGLRDWGGRDGRGRGIAKI